MPPVLSGRIYKETTEANEMPSLWCSLFSRSKVSVPVPHRDILSRSTFRGKRSVLEPGCMCCFFNFSPANPAANRLFHPRRDFAWQCPARRSCFTNSCRFLFSRAHAHIESGPMPLLVLLLRLLVSYQPPGLRMVL